MDAHPSKPQSTMPSSRLLPDRTSADSWDENHAIGKPKSSATSWEYATKLGFLTGVGLTNE